MALTAVEEAQLRDLIAQQSALLSLAGVEATILSKLGATKVTLSDLPTASVIDDDDLLLLRQGVTDKSVTGLTFKNLIPTVADASTTVKGVVELATDAETQTGTDPSRAITPSNLSARTATETRTGIAELATSAEAIAGTDDITIITPLKLRNGLNASGAAPIYACRAWVNFNGTGTVAIRASGNVSSITDNGVGNYTVNFTTAMEDANYSVLSLSRRSTSSNQASVNIFGSANSMQTTSVQIAAQDSGSTLSDNDVVCVSIFR